MLLRQVADHNRNPAVDCCTVTRLKRTSSTPGTRWRPTTDLAFLPHLQSGGVLPPDWLGDLIDR